VKNGEMESALVSVGLEVSAVDVTGVSISRLIFCGAGSAPAENNDNTYSCQKCEAGKY